MKLQKLKTKHSDIEEERSIAQKQLNDVKQELFEKENELRKIEKDIVLK